MNNKLTDLPNIGEAVATQLYSVGIRNEEELKQVGSKDAWLKIQKIDSSACQNRLMGLEGAIKGIRWHDLPQDVKDDLKEFYQKNKKN